MFCVILCFFFFKQKTAYEMRISDWSSDVCSSDLDGTRLSPVFSHFISAILAARPYAGPTSSWASPARFCSIRATCCGSKAAERRSANPERSEEHTSELQSLMRISYAVFCLKKKTERRI